MAHKIPERTATAMDFLFPQVFIDKFFKLPSNNSMELQELSPTTIHCPHCQRKFLVATKSLTEGEARFQCTSCHAFFAMNWKSTTEDKNPETYVLAAPKQLKKCFKCQHDCDESATECPSCGVLFDKAPSPIAPIFRANIGEISRAWEEVRKDYGNENGHHRFIKLCADQDQLVYATQQYKAILTVNPNEYLAQKMQRMIIQMVDSKQQMGEASKTLSNIKIKFNFYKLVVFLCLTAVAVGIVVDPLRHLIALGSSVLIFALILKHWISKSEI